MSEPKTNYYLTKAEVLNAPDVHNFTKLIIREAEKHDIVDAIADIKLALKVVEDEFKMLEEK